jgi:hypothetical protein
MGVHTSCTVTFNVLLREINLAYSYTPPPSTLKADGVFRYTLRMLAGVCEGEAVGVGVYEDEGVIGASFHAI